MAKKKPVPLSAQIRAAIQSSGLSMLAVGRAAEIDKAALSRFLSGKNGLRLDALDRLGLALGLRVVRDGRTKADER